MKLEQVSAHPRLLLDTCNNAGISIVDGQPVLRPENDIKGTTTVLQPWQPSAIAWLMHQIDSPLYGGILSDACGLGQTLTSLCLLYYSARRILARNEERLSASLIVVPARVLLQ